MKVTVNKGKGSVNMSDFRYKTMYFYEIGKRTSLYCEKIKMFKSKLNIGSTDYVLKLHLKTFKINIFFRIPYTLP